MKLRAHPIIVLKLVLVVTLLFGLGQNETTAEDSRQAQGYLQRSPLKPAAIRSSPDYRNTTPARVTGLVEILRVKVDGETDFNLTWLDQTSIVMAATDAGLWTVDVSNPESSPELVLEGFILKVSLDGQVVVMKNETASTIDLVDTTSGELLFSLDADFTGHNVVDLNTNSHLLASASDSSVQVWDYVSQTEVTSHELEGSLGQIRFSPHGDAIVSARICVLQDCPIIYWDISTLEEVWSASGAHINFALTVSPSGEVVAGGGYDVSDNLLEARARIRVLDATTGEVTVTIVGDWRSSGDPITYYLLAFSPDDTLLAASTSTNTIEIWDVQQVSQLAVVEEDGEQLPRSIAFSADGTMVASINSEGMLVIWEVEN